MKKIVRKVGRPKMQNGKRTKIIKARLTEDEFKQVLLIEQALGITRMELIRTRVLYNSRKIVVDAADLLKQLDAIGTELGRAGNNINQLARHANTLAKNGALHPVALVDLNQLLGQYIAEQRELEKIMRGLLRMMKG